MDSILAGLNAAQKTAVQSPAGVLQILAPPGSGKTKTLTARVAHLVKHENLLPWSIVVCTFTIKAAREMKIRLRDLLGEGVEGQLILGTFHSVARRFLLRYGHLINIQKTFGIADTSDSEAMLKRIIKRRKIEQQPGKTRARISKLKARGIGPETCNKQQKPGDEEDFAIVYADYEQLLKVSNLLDYDDLLLKCHQLLSYHPKCAAKINAVLIDEFQDTNQVQYELMKSLASASKRITIVGDPDQSIYGFRNAEIKNLMKMRDDYPETMTIMLEENYRSSGSILLTAMDVIEQDESRPAKRIMPTHCTGVQPVLHKAESASDEAKWIVTEIESSNALTGSLFNYDDFVILLRSAFLSRQIESALARSGIPYRMVGGLRFFDRVEVKLVLDYLRVIDQPDQNDPIIRIINVPPRRVGDVTMKKLIDHAEITGKTLWSILEDITRGQHKVDISGPAKKGIERFFSLISSYQDKLAKVTVSEFALPDYIGLLLEELGLKEYLKKDNPAEEFEGRWSNVQELLAQASDSGLSLQEQAADDVLPLIEGLEQRDLNENEDLLARFLANIALSTEVVKQNDESSKAPKITISTIHAAKGLEWPIVFIPSAYDGSIPHSRAEDVDEERRLLYVGMTRAKALLYLSYPLKKSFDDFYGETYEISPFLKPKSTQAYFAKKSSLKSFSVVQDLARILGRACPSQSVINASVSAYESKRIDTNVGNDNRLIYGGFVATSNPKKRQKGVEDQTYKPTFIPATTMQNPRNYTISSTTIPTNFVSARTCMTENETKSKVAKSKNAKTGTRSNSKNPSTKRPPGAYFQPYQLNAPSTANPCFLQASIPSTAQSIPPANICANTYTTITPAPPTQSHGLSSTKQTYNLPPASFKPPPATSLTAAAINAASQRNAPRLPAFKPPTMRQKGGFSEMAKVGTNSIVGTVIGSENVPTFYNANAVTSKLPPGSQHGNALPLSEILNANGSYSAVGEVMATRKRGFELT